MAFRDRAAQAAATPAQEPTEEAVEVTATVEVEPEPARAAPASTGLSLVGLAPSMSLAAAIDATVAASRDGSGGGPMFPTTKQNGGRDARGAFGPLKGTPEDLVDLLPEGTRPFHAVLLGYRWEYTAWKWPYQEVPEGEDQEEAAKPAYSFALPATAIQDIALANKACAKYQFTKKEARVKFNFNDSQCGHLTPVLAMLCYCADLDNLIVVATPNTLDSGEHVVKQMRGLLNKEGLLEPKLLSIKPEQVTKPKTTYTFWAPRLTPDNSEDAARVWTSYSEWLAQARDDAELIQSYTDWMAAGDEPITEAHRLYLRNFPVVAAR